MQTPLLTRSPAAGMFIDPGNRQIQAARQPLAVTAAMQRLLCGTTAAIQGQPHHQRLHPSLAHQRSQPLQIGSKASPGQGPQGRHREAKGIAAGQANAFAAHIQGQR